MSNLLECVAARVEGEGLLELAKFDSGASLAIDASARWVLNQDGAHTVFTEATAPSFSEVLETPRDAFEASLAASGSASDLPGDELVAAFPAVVLVRAILKKQFAYVTRLALLWLRPSELRELRADIVAVSESREMPGPVRDLARRLTVPDGYT